MTSRAPKSRRKLEHMIMMMATGKNGLTWRRLHDALPPVDRDLARDILNACAVSGQLHQRHYFKTVYHFATAALAAAWTPPPAFNPRPAVKTAAPPKHSAAPAAPPVQVCRGWTHDPRYQIQPGAAVPAVFSALGVGRYLED